MSKAPMRRFLVRDLALNSRWVYGIFYYDGPFPTFQSTAEELRRAKSQGRPSAGLVRELQPEENFDEVVKTLPVGLELIRNSLGHPIWREIPAPVSVTS